MEWWKTHCSGILRRQSDSTFCVGSLVWVARSFSKTDRKPQYSSNPKNSNTCFSVDSDKKRGGGGHSWHITFRASPKWFIQFNFSFWCRVDAWLFYCPIQNSCTLGGGEGELMIAPSQENGGGGGTLGESQAARNIYSVITEHILQSQYKSSWHWPPTPDPHSRWPLHSQSATFIHSTTSPISDSAKATVTVLDKTNLRAQTQKLAVELAHHIRWPSWCSQFPVESDLNTNCEFKNFRTIRANSQTVLTCRVE